MVKEEEMKIIRMIRLMGKMDLTVWIEIYCIFAIIFRLDSMAFTTILGKLVLGKPSFN
jgi:hypothetical protein